MQIKFFPIALLILPLSFDRTISADIPQLPPKDPFGLMDARAPPLRKIATDDDVDKQCNAVYAGALLIAKDPNWREDMEKSRRNFIELGKKCAAKLGHGDENVKSIIEYNIEMMELPDTKRTWMIVAIVFIVAFSLAMIGLGVMAFILFNRKRLISM